MSTMERLFMKIYERRDRVESQLRQQKDSYCQALAFKLAADGRRPPPWLLDAPAARSDAKELNKDQLISEILFPLRQNDTSMTDHINLFTLPTLKDSCISQSNSFFTEMCALNNHAEKMDKATPNGDEQDAVMMVEPETLEASSESDPTGVIQHSQSRQRDPEIHLSNSVKAANNHGQSSTMDENSGRTRCAVVPVSGDYVHNEDGEGFTHDRSKNQMLGCDERSGKPVEFVQLVEDTAHKATKIETNHGSGLPLNADSLDISKMDDVPHISATGIAAEERASGASSHVHSNIRPTCDVANKNSEHLSVVEPKRLLFDGFEECRPNENSATAFAEEDHGCSNTILSDLNAMQSVKESSLGDSEKALGSLASGQLEKEDDFHTADSICRAEEVNRISTRDLEEEIRELNHVEDSKCHSQPTSCDGSFRIPALSPIKAACIIEHISAHTSFVPDGVNVSGKQQISKKGLSEGLQLPSSVASWSYEELPKNLMNDNTDKDNLNKKSVTALVEDSYGKYSSVDCTNLETEALPCKDSSNACFPYEYHQVYLRNVFPIVELTRSTREETTSDGSPKDKDKLFEVIEPGSHSQCISCNNKSSQSSAISSMGVISGQAEEPDFSRQLLRTFQNDGSALLSSDKNEMLLENEVSDIAVGEVKKKRISQSTTPLVATETHTADSNSQQLFRNLSTDNQISGFIGSNDSLLFSSKRCECLPSQVTLVETSNKSAVVKSNFGMTPNIAEIGDALAKPHYSLRSSRSPGIHNSPTRSRYFLRNSTGQDKNATFPKTVGKTDADSSTKLMKTVCHAYEISWPKRKKLGFQSENNFATPPRSKPRPFLHIQDGTDNRCKADSGAIAERSFLTQSSETEFVILNPALESPLAIEHQSKKCTVEGGSYIRKKDHTAMSPSLIEHAHEPFLDSVLGSSMLGLEDRLKNTELDILNLEVQHTSEGDKAYAHGEDTSEYAVSKSTLCYDEFPKERGTGDGDNRSQTPYAAGSSHFDGNPVDCDETMPDYEGFSIGIPSNLEGESFFNDSDITSLTEERAHMLEQLCRTNSLITPGPHTLSKPRIYEVPDVHRSLPAGFLEHLNLRSSFEINDVDMKKYRASEASMVTGIHFNLEFDTGDYLAKHPSLHSLTSSSASYRAKARKPPLTPPVEKLSQRFTSKRSISSDNVGSNPELTCFRIDENSETHENGFLNGLDASQKVVDPSGANISANIRALVNVTTESHSSPTLVSAPDGCLERASLESVNTDSCVRTKTNAFSSLKKKYPRHGTASVNQKSHVLSSSRMGVGKVGDSVHFRSGKPDISGKTNERNKSQFSKAKGCKPKNLISDICSFVPLVKQKQDEAAPKKGKKAIKVKALEAAEAAKRLEERKQHDREMRKAAAKLERERLEQENTRILELRQKQKEEEKRKKEAELAAKKRQRDEEKMEKQKKRKCTEEARKQQREQDDRFCAEKEEKELRRKAAEDNEKKKKELGEAAKLKLKSVKEVSGHRIAAESESNASMSVLEDASHDNSLEGHNASQIPSHIKKAVTNPDSSQEATLVGNFASKACQDLQSYEMSPYVNSDDEDEEEDTRRKKKDIPLWARWECLNQIILSKKDIEPSEIFSRKRSFNLNEVFLSRIRQRPM